MQFALLITEGQVKRESMTPFFLSFFASCLARAIQGPADPGSKRYHPRFFLTRPPRITATGSGSRPSGKEIESQNSGRVSETKENQPHFSFLVRVVILQHLSEAYVLNNRTCPLSFFPRSSLKKLIVTSLSMLLGYPRACAKIYKNRRRTYVTRTFNVYEMRFIYTNQLNRFILCCIRRYTKLKCERIINERK